VGEPVEIVARKTGRVVGGVYTKLMNLRSLDPREAERGRKGMGSTAITDREVWAEFYDTVTRRLRSEELLTEYQRLWEGAPQIADIGDYLETVAEESKRLQAKPLDELIAAYNQSRNSGSRRRPKASVASTTVYVRDPLVVAIVKTRAGNRCEVPACQAPVFTTVTGDPYCEVHHLKPLSEGGTTLLRMRHAYARSTIASCKWGRTRACLRAPFDRSGWQENRTPAEWTYSNGGRGERWKGRHEHCGAERTSAIA